MKMTAMAVAMVLNNLVRRNLWGVSFNRNRPVTINTPPIAPIDRVKRIIVKSSIPKSSSDFLFDLKDSKMK